MAVQQPDRIAQTVQLAQSEPDSVAQTARLARSEEDTGPRVRARSCPSVPRGEAQCPPEPLGRRAVLPAQGSPRCSGLGRDAADAWILRVMLKRTQPPLEGRMQQARDEPAAGEVCVSMQKIHACEETKDLADVKEEEMMQRKTNKVEQKLGKLVKKNVDADEK